MDGSSVGQETVDLVLRGDHGDGGDAHPLPLSFVRQEEEGVVLPEGPAEGAAELVVAELALLEVVRVEVIARIQGIIAEVLIDAAVEAVGA